MAMVCPQCSKTFEQSAHCPTCGVRLLYESKPHRCDDSHGGRGGNWLHTPFGRIVVGILLAQGLAYGLQLLFSAGLQITVAEGQPIWSTFLGLVLLQAIQGFSLLAGGAFAGAGQRQATVVGAVVGLMHGVIFLVWQRLQGEQLTEVVLYGQPVLHVALGTVGAVLGARIWQPLPVLAMPEFETDKRVQASRRESSIISALRGPVAWGRVCAGIVIVTTGFLWGPGLLALLLDASHGKLRVTDQLQAQLVAWEITGLMTLLGSAFAGATTRNGLKQGLFTGLGACVVLIGNLLSGNRTNVEHLIFMAASIIGLTAAGGWFGGQLFPPVLSHSRRRGSWTAL